MLRWLRRWRQARDDAARDAIDVDADAEKAARLFGEGRSAFRSLEEPRDT